MKKIEQSAVNWQELLEQKNREIKQLETQIQWLTQQMMLMKSGKFGASTEKTVALMDKSFVAEDLIKGSGITSPADCQKTDFLGELEGAEALLELDKPIRQAE